MKNAGEMGKIYFDQTHDIFGAFANESRFAIRVAEVTWPTVSHYLLGEEYPGAVQAGVRLTDSVDVARQLIAVGGFARRPKWDALKDDYLNRALSAKFTQHLNLETLLLGTGIDELIYTDQDDWYYGVGSQGFGHNMLGRLLMRVRRNLNRLSLDYVWGEGTARSFEQLEAEVQANPTSVYSISRLAEGYLAIGKPEDALVATRHALALSKECEEWNYRILVLSLVALGMHEEALAPIKHLTRLDPEDPNYLKWLAFSLTAVGKDIPAKLYARRARQLEQEKKEPNGDESGAW